MRALLAFLLLCSAAQADTLRLLVFKGPRCQPCMQFDSDYSKDASFRNALKMFECVPAFTSAKREHNATFERYGVSVVPTFIVTLPDGTEVGRVNGYKSKEELVSGLIKVGSRTVQPKRQSTRPPAPSVPPSKPKRDTLSTSQVEELRGHNRQLIDKVYVLEEEVLQERRKTHQIRERLEAEAAELRKRASVPTEKMSALQRRYSELQRRLRSMSEEAETNEVTQPSESEQASPRRGFLRSIFHHGVNLALDVGLSSAQAEVLVPVAAATGPIGIGAVAGLWLLKRMRRRGQSRARGDPDKIIVDPPQAPTNHSIETQFVNVESDNYQRAHQKARQHIARRYPGSQEVLDAELNLTQQFFAGQRPGE